MSDSPTRLIQGAYRMTPKDTGPMPFIAVKDFGPIANAEVELRPLTVLIGANNTGKSYLALAVYALFQAISGTNPRQWAATARGFIQTTLGP